MRSDDYTLPITQANCVINSLNDEVKNKIPQNIDTSFL